MLEYIFKSILITSLIGTIATLFLTIIKPITRKIFSSSWHYYMWLIVLVAMILPIRISLPKDIKPEPVIEMVSLTDNEHESSIINDPIQIVEQDLQLNSERESDTNGNFDNLKSFTLEKIDIIALAWFVGMLLLFMFKIMGYCIFLIKLRKKSCVVDCPELIQFTNKKVTTRRSDKISSPLMIGLFRPTLLLPETMMTEEQLNNVLAHEMTHFKRKDILYKWFICIVKCVHWFNPAIYYVSKQADIECEISCDLAVVKEMSDEQESNYINTIITLLAAGNRRKAALTTGMTSDKKTLKRRFTMIKKRKRMKKSTRIVSAVLALVLLLSTLFVSGVLATTVFEEDSNITFICNGNLIEFDNKPFYENNTVYLPLREVLNKVGIMDHKNSSLEWKNGRIIIKLAYDDEVPTYDDQGNENGTKDQTLNYCYAIEIGKAEFEINPKESPMSSSQNPAYIAHLSAKIRMKNAPILRNNITYVDYAYVDRILDKNMRGLGPHGVDGPYDITCIVDAENPIAYVTPGFFWPVQNEIYESISKDFGMRVHPITGETMVHNGVDTIAPENSEVVTAIRGKVTNVGYDNELGNYVVVANDNGISTLYGHLSSVDVKEGDCLSRKAIIGKVGKTGTATGACLHFEIKINGVYYDPLNFWHEDTQEDVSNEITPHANENVEPYESKKDVSDQENPTVGFESSTNIGIYTPVKVQDQSNTIIKSTIVGDEPYIGFEHLVLKNADTNKIKQELNKQGIVETKKLSVDLTKNYVVKDYSSEQTKVESDKNGNISLYFSVNSDNLFDVRFYDAETGEDVGSYGVLANNENAYTFIGFEKGKTYNVEVQGQTKGDWAIEGNYIIY